MQMHQYVIYGMFGVIPTVPHLHQANSFQNRSTGTPPQFQSVYRAILVSSVQTPLDRARLLAVASPHAGDWLKALPIASCGLRLDDEAVRVSVGLKLGLPICKPHTCVCGAVVDERGLHGLSCMRGIGRLSRHNHINDTMCRAFASAGMPTVKEPTGLIPGTELRPDGLTLIPWSSVSLPFEWLRGMAVQNLFCIFNV